MSVSVDDVKQALCVEINDDDSIIQDYIMSAEAYIQDAVSPTADLSEYQQFDFAVAMLAQFWYLNRDVAMQKQPYQVTSMIQQLRSKIIE